MWQPESRLAQEIAHLSLAPRSKFSLQESKVNTLYRVDIAGADSIDDDFGQKAVLELLAYTFGSPIQILSI